MPTKAVAIVHAVESTVIEHYRTVGNASEITLNAMALMERFGGWPSRSIGDSGLIGADERARPPSQASGYDVRSPAPPSPYAEQPLCQPEHWVTNFFAEQIAPWMCPVLQADNECKMHLLPLAMSSPLVLDAVAAAAYHRLAYYGNPQFASKAEHHKASAIRGLITSARSVCTLSASSSDQLFAAATLLILMYDEMIAAQDTFVTLARIIGNMRKFVDFSSLGGSEKLQRYLTEQFGFLTIFSLPHTDDDDIATDHLRAAFSFVEEFAESCARDKHNPPFLAECFRTILTVWHGQKHNSPSLDVNLVMEDFKSKIEATSDITVFDHYLTWVYFMSSAASSNAPLRNFFKDRLHRHTTTFGWKNVAMMHAFLGELEGAGVAWPERLQLHKKYICA
ncbi:cyclopentanone 1 2-monooxygenase [Fusarium mundagurra]|uniref:Cyclopentanone 1 2-monooxygenase n=1 Tax=Fusarium mundagurra TaxID=1567541 RepID=A0A8H5Y285_9HYPO|nr:cyclopentanone 1 2-monooxygenase [Fusarium mundagurra]